MPEAAEDKINILKNKFSNIAGPKYSPLEKIRDPFNLLKNND